MKVARSRWTGVVLVCGKCSRKLGGGFGPDGRTPLAKALRKVVGKGRKASAGVIETKCLKLCPKGAVCVIDARRPGEWLVVEPGEEDALIERFGLDPHSQGFAQRRRERGGVPLYAGEASES